MSKQEQMLFNNILIWFASTMQPGVNHVCFRGKIYWVDSKTDMEALYKIWEKENE